MITAAKNAIDVYQFYPVFPEYHQFHFIASTSYKVKSQTIMQINSRTLNGTWTSVSALYPQQIDRKVTSLPKKRRLGNRLSIYLYEVFKKYSDGRK